MHHKITDTVKLQQCVNERELQVYAMKKMAVKRLHLKNKIKFCEFAFITKIAVYLNIFLGRKGIIETLLIFIFSLHH